MTARQIATQLLNLPATEVANFRSWLSREKGRGHNHLAPESEWVDQKRPTYYPTSVVARWGDRPGHGGRPPQN